jgi:hypothetical protein
MRKAWEPIEVATAEQSATYDEYLDLCKKRGLEPRNVNTYRSKRMRMGLAANQSVSGPTYELPQLPASEDYEGDVEAYYEAVKQITAAKINLVDKPTTIEWTAPDNNWTGIVFVGDIHIGGLIDYRQLEHDLDTINETPGLHVIGMGDYSERFEGAGKLQHAMSGDTVPGSDDQEMLVHHVLGRCTKWVAILAGNHDEFGGGEGVRRLAKRVGASYVSQAGSSLKAVVNAERYVIYLKHQYVGASRISTSNEGRRFWTEWADFENADVTVLAHLHQPDTHQVERKGQTVAHMRGGTYKTVDPWARKGGYCPAYGPSLILLNPHEHEVLPFHGPNWRRGVQMLQHLRESSTQLVHTDLA